MTRSGATGNIVSHLMEHLLEPVWAEGDFEDLLTSALLVAIFTFGRLSHLLRAEGRR